MALAFAGSDIRSDKDVALVAVGQAGMALEHVAPHLKKDRDIVSAALESDAASRPMTRRQRSLPGAARKRPREPAPPSPSAATSAGRAAKTARGKLGTAIPTGEELISEEAPPFTSALALPGAIGDDERRGAVIGQRGERETRSKAQEAEKAREKMAALKVLVEEQREIWPADGHEAPDMWNLLSAPQQECFGSVVSLMMSVRRLHTMFRIDPPGECKKASKRYVFLL